MKRSILVLCVGIILGAIAVYMYMIVGKKGEVVTPIQQGEIPNIVSDVVSDKSSQSVPDEKGEIKDETAVYSIHAFYPTTGVGSEQVKTAIEKTVATFIAENETATENTDEKLVLKIDYTIEATATVSTYVVSEYIYTGGAHGFDNTKTYSFDMKGNQIELDDLFATSGYLQVLGDIVADKAYSALQDTDYANIDMIKAGTAPIDENFSRFYIKDGSIVFIFPPYAIAPYAAGTIEVEVPKATLGAITASTYW